VSPLNVSFRPCRSLVRASFDNRRITFETALTDCMYADARISRAARAARYRDPVDARQPAAFVGRTAATSAVFSCRKEPASLLGGDAAPAASFPPPPPPRLRLRPCDERLLPEAAPGPVRRSFRAREAAPGAPLRPRRRAGFESCSNSDNCVSRCRPPRAPNDGERVAQRRLFCLVRHDSPPLKELRRRASSKPPDA